MSTRRWLAWLVAFVLVANLSRAQIDLPEKPVVVPPAPPSSPLPEAPRGNLAEKVTGKAAQAKKSPLDLPANGGAPGDSAKATPAEPAPTPVSAPVIPVRAAEGPRGAASFILDQLRKARDVDQRLVDQAAQSLAQLGEDGRAAARFALAGEHAPTVLASAKVLLTSGDAHDAELVIARLRGKPPPSSGAALVDTLVALDPVRATPRLLCELLGHVQGAIRGAAFKHLTPIANAELLPYLRLALACDQSDGRLRAAELTSSIPGEVATGMLLERLRDRTAQVAFRAATALASRPDAGLDAELLGRVFHDRWVLREGAYALIAIVEREDLSLKPILRAEHVDGLLEGLQSGDSFISGSCAAALAGIGFRADENLPTPWLDQIVPTRLLRAVAGQDFSNDYSSLQVPATRRLQLITAQNFGSDGPTWIDWWTKNAKTFVGARATLPIAPADVGKLAISLVSTLDRTEAFTLFAPDAVGGLDDPTRVGERFVISRGQVDELVALFRREGALGPEHLPGTRGSIDGGARSLELGFGGHSKSFRFGNGVSEPWFEKLFAAVVSLRDKNRWQAFRQNGVGLLDAWNADHEWWDGEHSELERLHRLQERILQSLATLAPGDRDRGVEELARIVAIPEVADSASFAPLCAMIAEERVNGARAQSLIALAEASAHALHSPPQPLLDPALSRDLVRAIVKGLGSSGVAHIAHVMGAAGRDQVRAEASADEPLVRAVAASELARNATVEDLALIQKLLADSVEPVQVAAITALGDNQVEGARAELLLRARTATSKVRSAALEALGKLGGEGAYDALLLGLRDEDAGVEVASAKGFAALADPNTARLLVDLLSRGRDSPFFAPARDGLFKLGEAALPELLRVARSKSPARREAAILLAQEGSAEAAPVLMTLITPDLANPTVMSSDALVYTELAILTCVDFRSEPNPAAAWWNWWDGVVHDDSLAWLRAALERQGVSAPPPDAFKPALANGGQANSDATPSGAQRIGGSRAALEFLCAALARPESYIVERARRELGKLVGRDLGTIPAQGPERDSWIAALREKLAPRFP